MKTCGFCQVLFIKKGVTFMKNKSIDEFAEDLRRKKFAFSEGGLVYVIAPLVFMILGLANNFSSKKLLACIFLGLVIAIFIRLVWYLCINIGRELSIVNGFKTETVVKELIVRNWFGFEIARINDVEVYETYTIGKNEFAIFWVREFEIVAYIP